MVRVPTTLQPIRRGPHAPNCTAPGTQLNTNTDPRCCTLSDLLWCITNSKPVRTFSGLIQPSPVRTMQGACRAQNSTKRKNWPVRPDAAWPGSSQQSLNQTSLHSRNSDRASTPHSNHAAVQPPCRCCRSFNCLTNPSIGYRVTAAPATLKSVINSPPPTHCQ